MRSSWNDIRSGWPCGPTNAAQLGSSGNRTHWRPAAAWDGRHVVAAIDFGWRERRDPNAITYVIAANRVAPDAPRLADPKCNVLATTTRADQAVANPALVAGPGGEVLLLWEHDESVERQVIEARTLSSADNGGAPGTSAGAKRGTRRDD